MTAFDPARLVALPPRETRAHHGERDTMLYALAVGVGQQGATSPGALRFSYERGERALSVLPTMAVVLASPGFWLGEAQYGADWKKVLHGEESVQIHAPLPAQGETASRLFIERVVDKGAEKGAIVYSRREVSDAATGAKLATERRAMFLRGDGGCGDAIAQGVSPSDFEPLASVPQRAPDTAVVLTTREDQALLYRLTGDRNPLHADPAIAQGAGFRVPILHGLCTYGVVGRALLEGLCEGDATRFARMDCRFSSPVYPGETLATDIWREADGRARFQARVVERGIVVLSHGRFDFR